MIVLTVLTLRRRWGLRAMASTLAEYAAVAALAGLLVSPRPSPADQPHPSRPARPDRAGGDPAAGDPEVVGAGAWLAELWRRADPDAGRTPPPSTTRPNGEAMAAPPRSPTPPAPSIWRSHS